MCTRYDDVLDVSARARAYTYKYVYFIIVYGRRTWKIGPNIALNITVFDTVITTFDTYSRAHSLTHVGPSAANENLIDNARAVVYWKTVRK